MPSTSAIACSFAPAVRHVPRSKARTRMSRSDNAGILRSVSRGDAPVPPLSRGTGPMTKTVILSDPPRETKSRGRRSKLGWVAQFHCLTFLTDYGLEDAFVAVCHAVASQVAPGLPITDITHLIPLGDIRRGAMVLAQAVPYFPPAVHVAVVDPGVGTARRGVAVEAGGSLFVGPDNGLLSVAVAAAGGGVRAVSLTNRALWRDTTAVTFHGRDIF